MEPAAATPEPPALAPVRWLAGRWVSLAGRGKYPTIQEFQYHETIEFICVGQPMYNFVSASKHPVKQTPMHQERGFLRIKPGTNELAFVVSHNFGLTSIEEGTVDEEKKEIHLKSVSVSRMSFAKSPAVKCFERSFKLLSPDTLEVVLSMETENTPLCEHLRVTYVKEV